MSTVIRIIKSKEEKIDNDKLYFTFGCKEATIDCNIKDRWQYFNINEIQSVYEDFFVLGVSVFTADKKVSRRDSFDAWTREIILEVPVHNLEKWQNVSLDLNKMLSFLTGDIWSVRFYQTNHKYFEKQNSRKNVVCPVNFEAVSLFSGGLDSFCGAIDLFEQNKNICYVGNREYRHLKSIQDNLFAKINNKYPNNNSQLHTFTVDVHTPDGYDESENTTRSRSLMFISAGLTFASMAKQKAIPLYVPENGFIGLNLPMTPSRLGSCSTRTTHPYYINLLNNILSKLGIENRIINPYKFFTKKEIVQIVQGTSAFIENVNDTISCSHPSQRYKGIGLPGNCGYCYPCLIRQSSLHHLKKILIKQENDINSIITDSSTLAETDNLKALLVALYHYKKTSNDLIVKKIKNTGYLSDNDSIEYARVYIQSMEDILSMITNPKIKKFIGIN